MARTQAADYDKRRAAIMKAASALYAKQGFHATSVSDIAAATKTSKALLYHYFPSKEDLLFEVMDSPNTIEARPGIPCCTSKRRPTKRGRVRCGRRQSCHLARGTRSRPAQPPWSGGSSSGRR